ncbi:MAG: siroheme synthase CysG [Gammaproteobacteria bacterium]|nr:siroheme synthase CysG [Gammaproteobacteria bacterium]MDH5592050.1 siroheme synthase CysG [Gammaproteobacteria bacterium]
MDFFPAFLNLKEQPCLVVGGGEVAVRKVELLLKTGAHVSLVAPEINADIESLLPASQCQKRTFIEQDLERKKLVIVATDDSRLNEEISRMAREKGVLVNIVDNPSLCDFIVPSIIDRSPVVIAVGSSGSAPVLARLTRSRIEAMLPMALGKLAILASSYRQMVKDTFKNLTQRRRFWEQIFEGPVADKVYAGHDDEAEKQLVELLKKGSSEIPVSGEVALVGGGPGDPELLTLKAVRLLQRADVIVYDRLVSKGVMDLARRDAHKIYVGKRSADHTLPQDEINQLLVDLSKQGKRVVRLKGGDPFIFGRGGEEIATLVEHNVSFQVVPGITSASACSSYCGIPLTHRDYAQSVVFATGHLRDNSVDLNWNLLAQPHQTVVIYMGLTSLNIISKKLIEHGLDAATPIAIIYKATLPEQRIVIGDMNSIEEKVKQANLKPPSLIIIGEVVKLHEQLT